MPKMKVKIYTIKDCMFCQLAKQLLKKKNIKYEEIIIDSTNNTFENLKTKTNFTTLPQIFINNTFIGGYSELKVLLENIKNQN